MGTQPDFTHTPTARATWRRGLLLLMAALSVFSLVAAACG